MFGQNTITGLLLFYDKENVLYRIIAILILILVLYKHSLCPRILEQGLLLFQDKENVWTEYYYRITIILGHRECFVQNNSNPYSNISSIQTFSLSQNTRIGITIILGQRECFYRNNSHPYSDISSIQTFSSSQNTRIGISIILGQRECLDRTNTRTGITIILGQRECFLQK